MTNAINLARTLAKGKKNLAALKAAHANPMTSPAGKATLEQAIVTQAQINANLERVVLEPRGRTAASE